MTVFFLLAMCVKVQTLFKDFEKWHDCIPEILKNILELMECNLKCDRRRHYRNRKIDTLAPIRSGYGFEGSPQLLWTVRLQAFQISTASRAESNFERPWFHSRTRNLFWGFNTKIKQNINTKIPSGIGMGLIGYGYVEMLLIILLVLT